MPKSIWTPSDKLALASKSAARRQILTAAGIAFDIVDAAVDERALEADYLRSGGAPGGLAVELAKAKALAGGRAHPERYTLGADQALLIGAEILHKAGSFEEARQRLKQLSGRAHVLRSGYALAREGEIVGCGADDAVLTARILSDQAIDAYLEACGADVLGSVGCYQIEGLGAHLFERVEGAHSTIMGLPLLPLLALLRREGLLRF